MFAGIDALPLMLRPQPFDKCLQSLILSGKAIQMPEIIQKPVGQISGLNHSQIVYDELNLRFIDFICNDFKAVHID